MLERRLTGPEGIKAIESGFLGNRRGRAALRPPLFIVCLTPCGCSHPGFGFQDF
jgi:hypothetical protein